MSEMALGTPENEVLDAQDPKLKKIDESTNTLLESQKNRTLTTKQNETIGENQPPGTGLRPKVNSHLKFLDRLQRWGALSQPVNMVQSPWVLLDRN